MDVEAKNLVMTTQPFEEKKNQSHAYPRIK